MSKLLPTRIVHLFDNYYSNENELIQSGVELEILTHLKSDQLPLFPNLELSKNIKKVFTFWENERFRHLRIKKFFIRTLTIFPAYTASDFMVVSFISSLIKKGEYPTSSSKFLKIIREFDENIVDLRITENNTLYIEHKVL